MNFNFYANAQTFVNLESGVFFKEINDIRNGKNVTLFSLQNDFQTPVGSFFRMRIGCLSNEKEHFSFLYVLKSKETNDLGTTTTHTLEGNYRI